MRGFVLRRNLFTQKKKALSQPPETGGIAIEQDGVAPRHSFIANAVVHDSMLVDRVDLDRLGGRASALTDPPLMKSLRTAVFSLASVLLFTSCYHHFPHHHHRPGHFFREGPHWKKHHWKKHGHRHH